MLLLGNPFSFIEYYFEISIRRNRDYFSIFPPEFCSRMLILFYFFQILCFEFHIFYLPSLGAVLYSQKGGLRNLFSGADPLSHFR